MSAKRKLTDDQIQWAYMIAKKRSDLEYQLARLPTVADMADALGCTQRYLSEVLSGRTSRSLHPLRIIHSSRPVLSDEQFKQEARRAAKRALMSGKIMRSPCSECGAHFAEMHHEDYAKPLEVTWLCHPCHVAIHKQPTV